MCGPKSAYFHNEVDVGGEGLHPVETGDEADGQEALLIHLPAQEEVPLQVVQAEVVLTAGGRETAQGAKRQVSARGKRQSGGVRPGSG